jgi:hypothetical protein
MSFIKIWVKKFIRKTMKRMPLIILVLMVLGLTARGIMGVAEDISTEYYNQAIAPLMQSVSFKK